LEGLSDLLQLAGYTVARSSSWAETEGESCPQPPNLAVVDLSSPEPDAYRLSESIHGLPAWAMVPVIFVSMTEDDRIRELLRAKRNGPGQRLKCYSPGLLGMSGLLEEVKSCLA
jgi:CheY-like chemotaxis protein